MFLLDTNVVSELRRGQRCDPQVMAWTQAQANAALFVSVITVMEIEIGVLRIERHDASQGARLRAWFERQVLPGFEGRVLSIDAKVARRCAALHVPDPRSERDALIAATALVHGFTVATRNIVDFERVPGIKLANPWEHRQA
jgi:toxin FitB